MVSSWLAVSSVRRSIQKFRKKSRRAKANRHVVERRHLRHLQTRASFILIQPVYNCSAFCLCDASYGLHFITFHYNSRHTCKQRIASLAAIVVAVPLCCLDGKVTYTKGEEVWSTVVVAPTATDRRFFKGTHRVAVPACPLLYQNSSPTANISKR